MATNDDKARRQLDAASDTLTIVGFFTALAGVGLAGWWFHTSGSTPNLNDWSTAWPLCFGVLAVVLGVFAIALAMAVKGLRNALTGDDRLPSSRTAATAPQR